MAFTYSGSSVPDISTYDQAVQRYSQARTWRDKRTERKLGNSDKNYHGITLRENGDVALRYHYTDVVTWHPDNSFSVRKYPSQSTDNFLIRCTPNDFATRFANDRKMHGDYLVKLSNTPHSSSWWWTEGEQPARIYRLNRSVSEAHKFKRNPDTDVLEPVDDLSLPLPHIPNTTPWVLPHVDRAKARTALREFGFHDFSAWLAARWAMGTYTKPEYTPHTGVNSLLTDLVDRSRWDNFLRFDIYRVRADNQYSSSAWGRVPHTTSDYPRYAKACVNKTLVAVRLAIYERMDVVDTSETTPYLTSLRDVFANQKAHATYDWV